MTSTAKVMIATAILVIAVPVGCFTYLSNWSAKEEAAEAKRTARYYDDPDLPHWRTEAQNDSYRSRSWQFWKEWRTKGQPCADALKALGFDSLSDLSVMGIGTTRAPRSMVEPLTTAADVCSRESYSFDNANLPADIVTEQLKFKDAYTKAYEYGRFRDDVDGIKKCGSGLRHLSSGLRLLAQFYADPKWKIDAPFPADIAAIEDNLLYFAPHDWDDASRPSSVYWGCKQDYVTAVEKAFFMELL